MLLKKRSPESQPTEPVRTAESVIDPLPETGAATELVITPASEAVESSETQSEEANVPANMPTESSEGETSNPTENSTQEGGS